MTHVRQYADNEGEFGEPEQKKYDCPKCKGQATVTCRSWESSDGGFEDWKYECACGHYWWVEGPDA